MPHAVKISDAKAAVVKEWEKLEQLSAWQMTKVKSKKEVIQEAQKEQRTVHLKNAELEHKFQKYKGLVVLRCDTVKDEFTGGGGPARVPNLRVCCHSRGRGGTRGGGRRGLPARVSGRHKVQRRQSSPILAEEASRYRPQ